MNLFVGGISYKLREEELKMEFEKYGEVSSVKIIMDKETGRSKGFGFVEMPNDDDAQKAIAGLNGTEIEGKKIGVNVAEERKGDGGGYKKKDFKKRDNNRW